MGLPNINIAFKTAAAAAVQLSKKGTVGLIIKDSKQNGAHVITGATEVPAELAADNQEYVSRTFLGYVSAPSKVILYVLPLDAANLTEALDYFATQTFDYLAGPPDTSSAESTAIASWVKTQWEQGATPRAVLPGHTADNEAVINFVAEEIQTGDQIYTAAQYCSRIAGLLAGTPMNISCTYAPLPEITDIKRMTKEEMDTAIDAGKFILMHDGRKVKVGRGINSLTTTTKDKGEQFKKIKIVDAVAAIKRDIQITAQDSYIGKYANSYDNKCLFITAIKGYFTQLEIDGVLDPGKNTIDIDVEAQKAYLQSTGVDVSAMSEQEIRSANTADKVFLLANIKILDAIEDIDLQIVI
ncbi:phage tail sheath subtilisin-like domain-containing protein [Anaeromassilibacillus senegalensis]|uniref:phage tail sheath subtilisin-like domain-containing protein n=1 Tax=Anaeromassilibacillus senegalensis TaxID=1673717 RepID=UPI0006816856|nr:phage tail sheath subtilisin-like domain-containing protein [Anaeromassilibacillus senegalensis]